MNLYDPHLIYMKQPAHTEGQMWKTALPLGNGITGALIFGAIAEEQVILTRHDLWGDLDVPPLPDVSDALVETRRLIDEGSYAEANVLMQNRLGEKGYGPGVPSPFPLGRLCIDARYNTGNFREYRRGINMAEGTAFVTWKDKGHVMRRDAFVSREDGIFYYRIRCGEGHVFDLSFDHGQLDMITKRIAPYVTRTVTPEIFHYEVGSGKHGYGALLCVEMNTPGTLSINEEKEGWRVECVDFTVKILSYAKPESDAVVTALKQKLLTAPAYDDACILHTARHAALYGGVDIQLAADDDPARAKSNEELLADAYEGDSSPILYEKLWKFGRYLFVSGTAKESNPFPLYGLWPGEYFLPWCQHVANQNVQMLHWHSLAGGLYDGMRALIHYYAEKMPAFRENAQKLFGCRGIYVPAYTAPEMLNGENISPPAPVVSVVLNWISGAGWLAYHFYQYYQYTQDTEALQSEILPFMMEAARFYVDYTVWDEKGQCRIYPSVSPENTPRNLIDGDYRGKDYLPNPVTQNATMDFAIMKSLLHNLLSLHEDGLASLDPQERAAWSHLLDSIPDYMINEDGAIKEWMTPALHDNYAHRHFSHLFPLFPGDEIDPTTDNELLRAAERAVVLRETDSQSGWSFAHSACMWARFGKGDEVLESIDRMAKSCTLSNFFTLHNDWRHMGVSMCVNNMAAPVQLDALMGITHAIQEMLVQYRRGKLSILPASTDRLPNITARNLRFPGGQVSLTWRDGRLSYKIRTERDMAVHIQTPFGVCVKTLKAEQTYTFVDT